MIKKSNCFLAVVLFTLFASCASAQILEVDPSEIGQPVERPPHTGTTLSGTAGLLTIPTADFKERAKTFLSWKGGETKQNVNYTGVSYSLKKREQYMTVGHNIQPNLELTLNYLTYTRSSSPAVQGLDFREESMGLGLKYSTRNGKEDFCMGASFAPMSAEELNKADLWQIEQLRNVYMTFTEDLAENFHGYLHIKDCFTAVQKIILPTGKTIEINRKDFLVSAVGLEYSSNSKFALIGEAKWYNYRDIYSGTQEKIRYSVNGGLRLGGERANLEVMGISLNSDPFYYFGTSLGF